MERGHDLPHLHPERRLLRAARSLESSRRIMERAKSREERALGTLLTQMALTGDTQLVVGAYRLILTGEDLSVERLATPCSAQLALPEFPAPASSLDAESPASGPTPDDSSDSALSQISTRPARPRLTPLPAAVQSTPALYESPERYLAPSATGQDASGLPTERPRQVRFLAPEDASFLLQLEALLERSRALVPGQYTAPERESLRITGPADVAALLQTRMASLPQEQLRLLTLTIKHTLLGEHLIAQGGLSSASVRPADVFRVACLDNAAAIIVVHNHPSGDPAPSAADVQLTRLLRQVGEHLSLPLLDHVILARHGYVSLREGGYMG